MTAAERAHVGRVKAAGCICCQMRGFPHDRDGHVVEAHHLLRGGRRIGHMDTIGLCLWHHRGRLVMEGLSHASHRDILGPSLAEGSVPFHAEFGSDEDLLAYQRRLLEYQARECDMPWDVSGRCEAGYLLGDAA
ncbi:Ref family recombination enhancement nuclease [Coralloluteibacterium thermophilus]|uniref:Ref family recombination enhancement nuclease n=2 Tax=Coralloluteibacterium thermophilum TaxID=2707049 RepID=A0ABV9NR34_9GAMM